MSEPAFDEDPKPEPPIVILCVKCMESWEMDFEPNACTCEPPDSSDWQIPDG